MIFVLAVFTVLGLYLETGLQLFLLFTDISTDKIDDNNITTTTTAATTTSINNTATIGDTISSEELELIVSCYITVSLLALAFIVLNVASLLVAVKGGELLKRSIGGKVACVVLHCLLLGLVWRLYTVLFQYNRKAWLKLCELRLVHVSLLSFPYLILQGRLMFVVEIPENSESESTMEEERVHRAISSPLPVVVLVVSLASCAVAMCAFVLRHKLHEALALEGAEPARKKREMTLSSSPRSRHAGIFVLVLGTFMCLSARLGSFSLLSAQHDLWVFLPFLGHFFIHVALHIGCWGSTVHKSDKDDSSPISAVSYHIRESVRSIRSVSSSRRGVRTSADQASSPNTCDAIQGEHSVDPNAVHSHHRHHHSHRHSRVHQQGANGSAQNSIHSHNSAGHQKTQAESSLNSKQNSNHSSALHSPTSSAHGQSSHHHHRAHNPALSDLQNYANHSSPPPSHTTVSGSSHNNSFTHPHHNVTSIPTHPITLLPINSHPEFTSLEGAAAAELMSQNSVAVRGTAGVGSAGEAEVSSARAEVDSAHTSSCCARGGACSTCDVMSAVVRCYLNTVDLVEEDLRRVQCRYVFYYSVVLVENLAMTAAWLLPSTLDYTAKLLVAVGILGAFLAGLILKFASCGCIVSSSRTSDAVGISRLSTIETSEALEQGSANHDDGRRDSHWSVTALQHSNTAVARRHGKDPGCDDDDEGGVKVKVEDDGSGHHRHRRRAHQIHAQSGMKETTQGPPLNHSHTTTTGLSDSTATSRPSKHMDNPHEGSQAQKNSAQEPSGRPPRDKSRTPSSGRKKKPRKHRSQGVKHGENSVQARLAPILANEKLLLSESDYLNHLRQLTSKRSNSKHNSNSSSNNTKINKAGVAVTDPSETVWSTETILGTVSMDPSGGSFRGGGLDLHGDLGQLPLTLDDPYIASRLVLESLRGQGHSKRERSRSGGERSDHKSSGSSKSKHHISERCSCEGYVLVAERNLSDPEGSTREVFLPRRSFSTKHIPGAPESPDGVPDAFRSSDGLPDAYRYFTRCSCRGSPSSTPRRRPEKASLDHHHQHQHQCRHHHQHHHPQPQQQQFQQEREARKDWSESHRSRSTERSSRRRRRQEKVGGGDGGSSGRSGLAKDASSASTGKKNKVAMKFPFGRSSSEKHKPEKGNKGDTSTSQNNHHRHHSGHVHRQRSHTVRVHHWPGCRLHGYDLYSDRALTWPRRRLEGQEGTDFEGQFRYVNKRRKPLPESFVSTEDVVRLWLKGVEDSEIAIETPEAAHHHERVGHRGRTGRQKRAFLGRFDHNDGGEDLPTDACSDSSVRVELDDNDNNSVNDNDVRVHDQFNVKTNLDDDDDDYGFKTASRQKAQSMSPLNRSPIRKEFSDRESRRPRDPEDLSPRQASDRGYFGTSIRPDVLDKGPGALVSDDSFSGSSNKPPAVPSRSRQLRQQHSRSSDNTQNISSPRSSESNIQTSSTSRLDPQGHARDLHFGDPRSRFAESKERSGSETGSTASRALHAQKISVASLSNSDGSRSTGQVHRQRSRSSDTSHSCDRTPDFQQPVIRTGEHDFIDSKGSDIISSSQFSGPNTIASAKAFDVDESLV